MIRQNREASLRRYSILLIAYHKKSVNSPLQKANVSFGTSTLPLPRIFVDPSPTEFLIGCVVFCVSITILYHRRQQDRYKSLVLAGAVAAATTTGLSIGQNLRLIILQIWPGTIITALLLSELGHRAFSSSREKEDQDPVQPTVWIGDVKAVNGM